MPGMGLGGWGRVELGLIRGWWLWERLHGRWRRERLLGELGHSLLCLLQALLLDGGRQEGKDVLVRFIVRREWVQRSVQVKLVAGLLGVAVELLVKSLLRARFVPVWAGIEGLVTVRCVRAAREAAVLSEIVIAGVVGEWVARESLLIGRLVTRQSDLGGRAGVGGVCFGVRNGG